MLFQPLVLGGLNGILSPVVTGAHQLLTDRTLDMRRYQRQKDDLERESLARNPSTAYYVSDEEFDRQIGELRWSPEDLNAMENMYEERASFSLRSLCVSAFRWLLEQLFEIASVIVDIIRTFYLIVLSILGPLVFAVSVFDGFRDSLVHWFAKYVSVYLWLPVADIFGAVLVGRILQGNVPQAAVQAAAAFVSECIRQTPEGTDERLGVWLEAALPKLMQQ